MPSDCSQTDAQLITAFKSGDESAFNQLVQRHSSRAYQLAYGVLGNRQDAQDVTQDVFIRIYHALHNFRGEAQFTTWLYRITLNLAKNKYRWNKCRGAGVKVSIDAPIGDDNGNPLELPDVHASPQDALQEAELQKQLQEELEKMPEVYRLPLVMKVMDDSSYEQIADTLHCKVGTVKSRINRARNFLKKIFL